MLKLRYPCRSQPSEYTTLQNLDIGLGLVCTVDIPPNTHFIAFDGFIRSSEQFQLLRTQGKGRYGLARGNHKVLDCYNYCIQGKCVASTSNNCLNLKHSITGERAKKNSVLIYDPVMKMNLIKSLSHTIPAYTEIMYSYGSSYKREDYIK